MRIAFFCRSAQAPNAILDLRFKYIKLINLRQYFPRGRRSKTNFERNFTMNPIKLLSAILRILVAHHVVFFSKITSWFINLGLRISHTDWIFFSYLFKVVQKTECFFVQSFWGKFLLEIMKHALFAVIIHIIIALISFCISEENLRFIGLFSL